MNFIQMHMASSKLQPYRDYDGSFTVNGSCKSMATKEAIRRMDAMLANAWARSTMNDVANDDQWYPWNLWLFKKRCDSFRMSGETV